MKNNRGSALLIALFIMATLGVTTLSASRIFIGEAKTTSSLIASTSAYYAAESALELQLYEYKKNNDFQWSNLCADASCQALSSSGFKDFSELGNTAISKGRTYFYSDIKDVKCSVSTQCSLGKDQTAQVTVPNGVAVFLNWNWINGEPGTRVMRVTYIDESDNYQHEVPKSIVLPGSAMSHQLTNYATTENIVYRFRPLGGDIVYWFTGTDGGIIDSNKTTIDAQGEFGDVKRQLQAVFDRTSGKLNSIFDYTILSQDSIGID